MPRKGENIYKRRDGRWEARYIHHYENDRPKYRYVYGVSYSEVKSKREVRLRAPDRVGPTEAKKACPFEFLAALWLENIRLSVKESTFTRYHRVVDRYLLPRLEGQPVAKMDQRYLSDLTGRLLREGGVKGGPLAPKTVADMLCVLKAIFRYGAENGLPCPDISGLKPPQNSPKRVSYLAEKDRQKLEQMLFDSEDTTSLGIIFTLFTGVRIGELCGLRWGDIDFEENTVHIVRTVERIADLDPDSPRRTKVIVGKPKTESACRVIPLPSFLAEFLQARRQSSEIYLLTGTDRCTEPHQYYIRYRKFLKRHQIDACTFHALRHSFATGCIEQGFDTKSLAEILGHASVSTTLAIYVHPSLRQKRMQMERLRPACLNAAGKTR